MQLDLVAAVVALGTYGSKALLPRKVVGSLSLKALKNLMWCWKTWLVGVVGLGWWLDCLILAVFRILMFLWFYDSVILEALHEFAAVAGGPLGWLEISINWIMTCVDWKFHWITGQALEYLCNGLLLRGWEPQSLAGFGVHVSGDVSEKGGKKRWL